MRRVIIIAALGIGLAGCSSMPSLDFFKSTPPNATVRLESQPPGADARTSLGPGCKTPCAVSVPATDSFSVTFSLDKFLTQTVAVTTTKSGGDFGSGVTVVTDPNPVFAELQAVIPPKRMVNRPAKKRSPKPAPADAAPGGTAFPPAAAAPAPSR